jgi:hypothetical protein
MYQGLKDNYQSQEMLNHFVVGHSQSGCSSPGSQIVNAQLMSGTSTLAQFIMSRRGDHAPTAVISYDGRDYTWDSTANQWCSGGVGGLNRTEYVDKFILGHKGYRGKGGSYKGSYKGGYKGSFQGGHKGGHNGSYNSSISFSELGGSVPNIVIDGMDQAKVKFDKGDKSDKGDDVNNKGDKGDDMSTKGDDKGDDKGTNKGDDMCSMSSSDNKVNVNSADQTLSSSGHSSWLDIGLENLEAEEV